MIKNKGISLIVLVITIIVIIIIAGAVILDLDNDNVMSKANEAKFKSNVGEYKSELAITKSSKYLNDSKFKSSTLNAIAWNGLEANITGTVKEYIKSMTVEDGKKFEITNGKLVYVGSDDVEKGWITEVGITSSVGVGINVIATLNSTINGGAATYSNPIIPKGFKAINDGTTWPTNWDTGLVIEDVSGNQFVWVPVNTTTVQYQKWCTSGYAYNDASISDDTLPSGITSEINQTTKYGGFYIARYEAGNASGILVSKKNAVVWNNINYVDSKTKSQSMYNTAEVKSGLLTGTEWDTVMIWLKNSGKNVTDSTTWGNHANSTAPANGGIRVCGYSENWKSNNLYDIAGNVFEWTNEKYSSAGVTRGGHYVCYGNAEPVSCRHDNGGGDAGIGFRPALYLL